MYIDLSDGFPADDPLALRLVSWLELHSYDTATAIDELRLAHIELRVDPVFEFDDESEDIGASSCHVLVHYETDDGEAHSLELAELLYDEPRLLEFLRLIVTLPAYDEANAYFREGLALDIARFRSRDITYDFLVDRIQRFGPLPEVAEIAPRTIDLLATLDEAARSENHGSLLDDDDIRNRLEILLSS